MVNRIKEIRINADVKQADLAKYLNVSQGTLSNWERGEYDIDNTSLIKIAKYFNCTTDYILCVDGKIENKPQPIPLPTQEDKPAITSDDLKFALFGRTDVDDNALNAVKKFARFVDKDEEDD